ncbi:MAG: M81 family metallopeptidase [Paracoccaceae bacterium]
MGFSALTAEFAHESNTFSIRPTGLAEFRAHYVLFGAAAIGVRGTHNTELAGFLDVGSKSGWRIDHILSAGAGPGGRVTREAFEALAGPIVGAAATGRHDGILLALHGAMVTDFCEDGEGELLARIRAVTRSGLPVAVTLDPHANVTEAMCGLADILVSFTTYPHIDMRETGARTARLLHRTMAGEIAPRTLRAARPMLEEVNGGRTDIGPMIARHAAARDHERTPGALAVSINGGFASADIAEAGPSVLVTFEGSPAPHRAFAEGIAEDIFARRHEVLNDYLTPAGAATEAVTWAARQGPLVIADYADNPGAGAYGDATALLAALLGAGVDGACFGALVDPEAVAALSRSAPGERVSLAIGGRTAPDMGGGPLEVQGTLIRTGPGRVTGDGPMLAGLVRDFGPTAVLRVGGIDILIVSLPHQILDLMQFRTFGIDPAGKRVVALKSMQHFRAAFAPIAGRIVVCDGGALCTTDYKRLPYRAVRRPVFPLDT